jgi:hypothetical protein
MGISFFPNPTDVNRYRRLRALGRALNEKVLDTVPAYNEIGDAIGMRRQGKIVFETEDESSVLADCCLYDWHEDGKNLIQRYAEAHPANPGTDEAYLFNAYRQAEYRILTLQSRVLDAGIYCYDVLNEEELFLMDLAFSRSFRAGHHGSRD